MAAMASLLPLFSVRKPCVYVKVAFFLSRNGRRRLLPIDHGCSLPDRLCFPLHDVAWASWPQSKAEPQKIHSNYSHFMNINELFVIPVEVFKSIHFLCHGAWNWQWHFVLNCSVAKCYQDLYDPDFSHKWRCLSARKNWSTSPNWMVKLMPRYLALKCLQIKDQPRWTPWSFKHPWIWKF